MTDGIRPNEKEMPHLRKFERWINKKIVALKKKVSWEAIVYFFGSDWINEGWFENAEEYQKDFDEDVK